MSRKDARRPAVGHRAPRSGQTPDVSRKALLVLLLASLSVACVRTPNAFSADRTAIITPTTSTVPGSGFDGMTLSAECGTPENPTNLNAIEAVDQYTVLFRLCNPDAAFPSKLAFPSMGIQPAEHLDSSAGAPLDSPIGTGPYQLAAWQPGAEIVMERFDQYWGDPASAATLLFQWQTDPAARLDALESGLVDGFVVAEDDATDLAEFNFLQARDLNVLYLGLNRDIAPMDNDGVRRAIAMALNKQALVDEHFPTGTAVANQFIPPEIFGYADAVTGIDFDPQQARLSLDQAGLPDGFEITLSYRDVPGSYLPDPAAVAGDIQRQLAQVGIRVILANMESGAFLDAVDAGDLPMYLLGWQTTYPDPANFLDFHFGVEASGQFGAHFPDLEETLAEAGLSSDQAARGDLYTQAARLINQYLPAIPIAHGGAQIAFRADVEGAHITPIGTESFATMNPGNRDSLVWMQGSEPESLYCADEINRDAFRACGQMIETMIGYGTDGGVVVPALAESYGADRDGTAWTFNLRQGVKFHDGSNLDANDVVTSFIAQWDASSPLHVGRTGGFVYFAILFGGFLNTPVS
jgi:peptide/nickel transport system substrate-binding protein